MNESNESSDETVTGSGAEPTAAAPVGERNRVGRLTTWIGGFFALWLALSLIVLVWQPGRFWQVGITLAVMTASIFFPKPLHLKVAWTLLAAAMTMAVFYLPSYALSSEVEFTIRGSVRDAEDGVYLVHTDYGAKGIDDPGETFRNTDSPLFWKVNSSDWDGVFVELAGHRVRARVIGIRFADASVYRNVIWVTALED